MNGAKIYKDNFRENPLMSLFFAETSPLLIGGVIGGIIILVIAFAGLHIRNIPSVLFTVGMAEMALFMLTTGKQGTEMNHKVVVRKLTLLFTKKEYGTRALDNSLSNFKIVGDYIERKNTLIAVFEVTPSDISFLHEEALEQFYQQIKMSYHNLANKMMLIAKKQTVKAMDYTDHFYSLYTSADTKREKLITTYQEELSEFINENTFKRVRYHAVFSTPLRSHSEKHLALSAKQLFDMGNRFTTSLLFAHIETRQLTHDELVTYCKDQTQHI